MGRNKSISTYSYPVIDSIEMYPDKPFGPQLCQLRRDNKIPLREISEKLNNMDLGNLYNWEKGAAHFKGSLDMAIDYAKVFNVKSLIIKL